MPVAMEHNNHYTWIEPLSALGALKDEPNLVCFYSAFTEAHTGRYSFLCWGIADEISGTDWQASAKISNNVPWHENAWFGWLGYGLRHATELLPNAAPSPIAHAPLHLMQFHHILRFDHMLHTIEYYHDAPADERWIKGSTPTETAPPHVASLSSNMKRSDYLHMVQATIERIKAGDFYQANITRKFIGVLNEPPCPIHLFSTLCTISPAPYSALIKRGHDAIISSSPECFLSIDATGNITARPIKGSARKSPDAVIDAAIQQSLIHSEKDHAENRMIVDLMRNDLSRISLPGSVKVTSPATLHSYATIHHLIPTINAQKLTHISTPQAVAHCFPPGSMTGAPKIAAMKWCSRQEPLERDIYSGAIGWFGGDGSCDLSVVIRTLILRDSQFEFQVGGGIVADSVPEQELQEILVKAKAIATLLGLSTASLESL